MTRSRASAKAGGTRWESAIVLYLQEKGFPHARRKAKKGAKDEGDVTLGDGWDVVIEGKDVRALALSAWVKEANDEAENSGVSVGVVWSKKKGKTSPGEGYVILSGATFVEMLRKMK